MENQTTIYKLNEDGFYSNVEAIECNKSWGTYMIDSFPHNYFKTFPQAKKALVNYVASSHRAWKEAYTQAKKLTKEML